jgi:hypothetical protein
MNWIVTRDGTADKEIPVELKPFQELGLETERMWGEKLYPIIQPTAKLENLKGTTFRHAFASLTVSSLTPFSPALRF